MRYCWSRYRYIRGGGRSPKVVEAASVCKLAAIKIGNAVRIVWSGRQLRWSRRMS